MATAVLYLIPAAGGLLRAQHVRGGRRRELPQVCSSATFNFSAVTLRQPQLIFSCPTM